MLKPQATRVLNVLRSGKAISAAQMRSQYRIGNPYASIHEIREAGIEVADRRKANDPKSVMYYLA